MRPTDFAVLLTGFLSIYLTSQKNASKNTISSYRDTFKLLLKYFFDQRNISAQKLSMGMITKEQITSFLDWLEKERSCGISTRNQRLAAIHSFFRYSQYEEPSEILHFQKVMSIPSKKAPKPSMPYLSPDKIKLLLIQPDKSTSKGRRDLTLLSVLYDSGCRVQELVDITVKDVVLDTLPVLILSGKGNKIRRIPLMKNTQALLEYYIHEHSLDKAWKNENPLFWNKQHSKLTREGVSFIISKYVHSAKKVSTSFPDTVTPHMFRRSKATHLLEASVNLIYIRDFLGHENIKTTEIYLKCNTAIKRKAIEKAYPDLIDSNLPEWNNNKSLLDWLTNLS